MSEPAAPDWVVDAIDSYSTGELTTIGRDGGPSTFPVAAALDRDRGLIITTTSVSYPAKIANVRRDSRFGIFFGYAPSSTAEHPPAVMVRGTATVDDESFERNARAIGRFPRLTSSHPSLLKRLERPWWRGLYRNYMTRVLIEMAPEDVLVWRDGACGGTPEVFSWR